MTTSFAFDPTPDVSPAAQPAAAGTALAHITDHEGIGFRKLILFLQSKQRVQDFCRAMLSCLQDVEDVAWALFTLGWNPDTLHGVNLDVLGEIVGEPRAGRADPDYASAVKVRILVNSSDGKAEQIYQILKLLSPTATVQITPQYPAALTVSMSTLGSASTNTASGLLRASVGAGIRVNLTVGLGELGSYDGTPPGGVLGSYDGSPLGFVLGSGA